MYLLFAGYKYYARGGFFDLVNLSENLEDLKTLIRKHPEHDRYREVKVNDKWEEVEWWHIFDTGTNKVVDRHQGAYGSEYYWRNE
jgi:hypothetical protein